MRHRRLRRKLGVKTGHRKALLRNLLRSLVIYKRIQTTYAKAKETSAFADKMIQLAKRGEASLHARRILIAKLGCPRTANTLITQIAPKFKERQGGYTRVLRLGYRPGDGAETALLEFTELIELPKKPKKEKTAKKEKEKDKKVSRESPGRVDKDKAPEKVKEKEKPSETKAEDKSGKKESEKKGGFLGALRKFLKGDDKSS